MLPDEKVLFISHYSGRNGAPLVLLSLLKWLKTNTDLTLEILMKDRGELFPDFQKVGKVILPPRAPRIPAAIARRTLGEAKLNEWEDDALKEVATKSQPVLIYSNTITNTRELRALGTLGIPILCHVHEAEYWIRHKLGFKEAKSTIPMISRFVAVDDSVKQFLVSGLEVEETAIEVIHAFSSMIATPCKMVDRMAARREWGFDEDAFIVGACGTVDWRKGADLFLSVARNLADEADGRNIRFVWIGGPVKGEFYEQLQYDINHAGLNELVKFAGPCSSPEKYYQAMDLFLLPSREDPCPLVMLEAAAFGLPIVCFAESGGAEEFVGEDAGIAVPYMDVEAMGVAVLKLSREPAQRMEMGAVAASRARTRHDKEKQCEALYEAMAKAAPVLCGTRNSAAVPVSARL